MASTADNPHMFFKNLFAGKLLSPAMLKEIMTFIPASDPGLETQTGSGLYHCHHQQSVESPFGK
jgi:hypothetical protein